MKFLNKQAAVNHLNKMIGAARARGVSQSKISAALAGAGLTGFAELVSAAPVDVTSLTTAVDFSTVITAILAVAAIMVGVYVAWKAAKMVIGAVKGL